MSQATALIKAHLDHKRSFEEFLYVYPVISRRSKGVSIGINLNPDKACNFDCAYCEVDRTTAPRVDVVDLKLLETELRSMIEVYQSGELFKHPPFDSAPPLWRRLNDIAFSGDGEPTTYKHFDWAVEIVDRIRAECGLDEVKIVLITDSAGLRRPAVRKGLDIMILGPHEIWGKLDAGTEEYYKKINRSHVPFSRIIDNLIDSSREFPMYIQTLFTRVDGLAISGHEVQQYIEKVKLVRGHGGHILGIQLYTIARPTPEAWVTALSNAEIDAIGATIRHEIPDLPVEVYYGQ